jgi:hypothetical protein
MANVKGDEIDVNHYEHERDEKDPLVIEAKDEEEDDNAGITDDQTNYIEEKTTGYVDEIIEEPKEQEEEDSINKPDLRSNDIPDIEPEGIDGDEAPRQEGGQNILFQIIKKRKMKSKQITKKKHKHKPQKRKSKRKEKSKLRNTRKKGKKKTRRKSKK